MTRQLIRGRLRDWQARALRKYLTERPKDFLAVATPGAGKTTFALRVAVELLDVRAVDRVVVVVPTEHLKMQWAKAAARVGISLDAEFKNSDGFNRNFDGVAVTYAQVSLHPFKHHAVSTARRTLVILDEIHHGGDAKSWGDGIREAYRDAEYRLALTGTPFRSDDAAIPFVRYEEDGEGHLVSRADHTYGYSDALADGVVRPVIFLAYSGEARWRDSAGEEYAARLGEPLNAEQTARAWKTALDPRGDWIPAVLSAAHTRLQQLRNNMPDAGGLVIASDTKTARAYAKILERYSSTPVTVVLSDEPGSSDRIDEFSASTDEWMVAVRMVSEGVDVPRLAVGVYATATQTPLFFAQAVGRFVRLRRRGELATVFLPTVPIILAHASTLERQRDHVLGRPRSDEGEGLWDESEAEMAEANRSEGASDELLGSFEAMDSQATFDHVLFDSQQYGMFAEPTSAEEAEYLGLPGLLDADQVKLLLAERQRRQLRRRDRQTRRRPEVALHRAMADRRKKLNSLVSQYARLRSVPHSHVHADLRRQCGGPPLAKATSEEVEERIRMVEEWLGR